MGVWQWLSLHSQSVSKIWQSYCTLNGKWANLFPFAVFWVPCSPYKEGLTPFGMKFGNHLPSSPNVEIFPSQVFSGFSGSSPGYGLNQEGNPVISTSEPTHQVQPGDLVCIKWIPSHPPHPNYCQSSWCHPMKRATEHSDRWIIILTLDPLKDKTDQNLLTQNTQFLSAQTWT